MQSSRPVRFIVLLVLCVLFTSGCSRKASDEELIRGILSAMQQNIENGELDKFMDHVSRDYLDGRAHAKQDIRNLARLHILRNRTRHLFHQVTQLQVSQAQHAQAAILVAMTGQPIESADSLRNLRAELMRFKVDFVFDDRWQVVSAEWARAGIGDFL